MINPKILLGGSIKYRGDIKIHIPTIEDVVDNPLFNKYVELLTLSQEEVEDDLLGYEREKKLPEDFNMPSPLVYLMAQAYDNELYETVLKNAFEFFVGVEVNFLYSTKRVLLGELKESIVNANSIEEMIFITEEDFFDFQNCIRTICGKKTVEKPNKDEDIRITIMKAKARYRDKIKEKEGSKSGDSLSLSTSIMSLCFLNIGITPFNVGKLPYAAITPILNMYGRKAKYELDMKSLLAGGDKNKINPKHWIKDFDN